MTPTPKIRYFYVAISHTLGMSNQVHISFSYPTYDEIADTLIANHDEESGMIPSEITIVNVIEMNRRDFIAFSNVSKKDIGEMELHIRNEWKKIIGEKRPAKVAGDITTSSPTHHNVEQSIKFAEWLAINYVAIMGNRGEVTWTKVFDLSGTTWKTEELLILFNTNQI